MYYLSHYDKPGLKGVTDFILASTSDPYVISVSFVMYGGLHAQTCSKVYIILSHSMEKMYPREAPLALPQPLLPTLFAGTAGQSCEIQRMLGIVLL